MSDTTVTKENIEKAEEFKNKANDLFKSEYRSFYNIFQQNFNCDLINITFRT